MSRQNRTAFTLVELMASIAIVAVIIAAILPAAQQHRRLAMAGEDVAHFRQVAALTGSYAADFGDRVWSYSWQSGVAQGTPWPDLNTPSATDLEAAQKQFTYLLRSFAGRPEMPVPVSFLPHLQNSHIVLAAYADIAIPSRVFVSGADPRRAWADDPRGYDQGLYTPNLGTGEGGMRHPYSSGITMGAAFYDQSAPNDRLVPSSSSAILVYPGCDLRPRMWSEVVHPSQKLFLNDRIARNFGPREGWYMSPDARQPVLMADGSILVRAVRGEANPGAHAATGMPQTIFFYPLPIEPPATGPQAGPFPVGPQWTRGRIAGRDFGGPEAPH